ncbi:murein DD-endopeptidase MepM/ murein hydrolase activator NlpD [Lachnotalea glycerini]|uniref:Murein DD-endopeptidase MepM/ murein hydrolase activator NlpD n=1 Tax=Lachnotalea glycerini TaxID=1763509 RepID=A0A318ELK5_9FIRM|nr:peptidoglycan DD-metalloendopeptidase family protein [Lachnotalea glycerini]PXV90137.1 murein DD-endopeptidase MepM/ murein hydrolase activator NlpD [Lachnotalea glycerini]
MKKYIIMALIILSFNLAFSHSLISYASKTTSSEQAQQEKKELEEELENANSESEELKSGLEDTQKAIDSLADKKSNIESYVKDLDSQLNSITEKIEEICSQIDVKELEIEETAKELEKAEEDAANQYEVMKKRIKFMYENGNVAYIELILNSKSFSQLLNTAEYINQITEYDQNMLDKFQETKLCVAQVKESLETEQSELKELQAQTQAKENEVSDLIDTKSTQIAKYESEILSAKELEDDYEADIKAQNEVIDALEKSVAAKKAEIKKIQEAEQTADSNQKSTENITTTYDGGTFTWPCPSSKTISSEYGNRLHPILEVYKFHNGIDISASTGSTIVAAYNGTVVGAGYNSSMGNYVMIDHGDGLYTIYMHASELYVSTGQNVSKGDTIAAVGSTGRSTGPHLHFGVRLNGSYVNPHSYVG